MINSPPAYNLTPLSEKVIKEIVADTLILMQSLEPILLTAWAGCDWETIGERIKKTHQRHRRTLGDIIQLWRDDGLFEIRPHYDEQLTALNKTRNDFIHRYWIFRHLWNYLTKLQRVSDGDVLKDAQKLIEFQKNIRSFSHMLHKDFHVCFLQVKKFTEGY